MWEVNYLSENKVGVRALYLEQKSNAVDNVEKRIGQVRMTERGNKVSRHVEQHGSLCEGENKSGEQRKLRMDFRKPFGK